MMIYKNQLLIQLPNWILINWLPSTDLNTDNQLRNQTLIHQLLIWLPIQLTNWKDIKLILINQPQSQLMNQIQTYQLLIW